MTMTASMTAARRNLEAVIESQLRVIKRLEARNAKLVRIRDAAQTIQREIYPRDVFVGCDRCHMGGCDCDYGIQLARSLADALDAEEDKQ